jgi:hypothetical protein
MIRTQPIPLLKLFLLYEIEPIALNLSIWLTLVQKNSKFYKIKVYEGLWSFFIEASLDVGKNKKSCLFLLDLKYTLSTCFESKKFYKIKVYED